MITSKNLTEGGGVLDPYGNQKGAVCYCSYSNHNNNNIIIVLIAVLL
jgi:hypothetical protein